MPYALCCLPCYEDLQVLLPDPVSCFSTSCAELSLCLRQVFGEENPEMLMAWGMSCDANNLFEAMAANIARSGMQPIEYLLR